jgi:hypothetical protein
MSNTLTVEKAESLVRLMTDGLVNIVDKTGEFLLKRELSPWHVGQRSWQLTMEQLSIRKAGKDGSGHMVSHLLLFYT